MALAKSSKASTPLRLMLKIKVKVIMIDSVPAVAFPARRTLLPVMECKKRL